MSNLHPHPLRPTKAQVLVSLESVYIIISFSSVIKVKQNLGVPKIKTTERVVLSFPLLSLERGQSCGTKLPVQSKERVKQTLTC